MTLEIELKLRISGADQERLKRHPFLRAHSVQRARSIRLHSVYFDTPELGLRQRRMALRLRRVGGHWVQTLKGGGSVQSGLHQRNEWDSVVPEAKLDIPLLLASGAAWPADIPPESLNAVFETDFLRHERVLDFQGALIELALDSGEIRAGGKRTPICELELELKQGDPQQLVAIAEILSGIVPLQREDTSKAAYGYRLYAGDSTPAKHG